MVVALIEWSLRQRAVVLLGAVVLVLVGAWSGSRVRMDAVPDITNPQVQINTAVPGLAPEETERTVSVPVETAMAGLPDMIELRSLSKFGLSQVTLVFADGVDLYRMRQLVSERLAAVSAEIPSGLVPQLAPIATGLGEIFYYALEYAPTATNKPATRREQIMELGRVHELLVKPLMRATPGVAEINPAGGYERQVVVSPHPQKLAALGLTVAEVAERVAENTRNAGGGTVEVGGEQIVVRSNSRVADLAGLRGIPLKFGARKEAVLLEEVAEVGIGHAVRTGAGTVDGEEAYLVTAIMLAGENSRLVAREVRQKLTRIQSKLPHGMVLKPLYDRAELVDSTIHTVEVSLVEGAVLVVAVLFLMLGNLRGAIIVALAIPLSMLGALVGMDRLGISGNLMSLGAIDFGLVIDGAVVMVENMLRHAADRQRALGRPLTALERVECVRVSAREVASPMFFGVLIITTVYLPVLALQGIEGKMFRPMAVVVMLALGSALVLALTLMPVLAAVFLGGKIQEEDNAVVRWTKAVYGRLLTIGLRFKLGVVLVAVGLGVWSGWLLSRMGAEFIPQLDEGSLAMHMIRGNSVGLEASLELQRRSETILRREFPEIRELFSRVGTSEIAMDPMGPNVADTYVLFHPRSGWRKLDGVTATKEQLGELMKETLARQVPGQGYLVSQPIQMRFNEIMGGSRADLVCKVYGTDFEKLDQLAGRIRDLLRKIPGGEESEFESVGRVPMIEIRPDRMAQRRYNIHGEEINRAVESALAGQESGGLFDGLTTVPVVVRLAEGLRADPAALRQLAVRTDDGGLVSLGQVATLATVDQVNSIVRENTQRRVSILVNVRGRDTAGFVEEATQAIAREIVFPEGSYFEFGGQFRNMIEARRRLGLVVPLALGLIFALIFISFGTVRHSVLVFVCVPLAATGGVFALWLRGMPFTISAGIGFIALSGIAVLNGIMLVSFINQLRAGGATLRASVMEGTLTRLRPKLMTALVASLGFVPMALSAGAGAEVQRPLATVVIGGIISSTFLTLLLLPVLYEWVEERFGHGGVAPGGPGAAPDPVMVKEV